jgi:hypothetical protein
MFRSRKKPTKAPHLSPLPAEDPLSDAAIQSAQLRRLAELGMQLAESAARLAQRDMAEPPPDPEPVTAEEIGTEHLYYPCPTGLAPTPPRNPGILFNQFARTVRDCITLQNRLTAQQNSELRPLGDPRRPILRRAVRHFIATQPKNFLNLHRVEHAIDHELEADPESLTPLSELLPLLCEALGLNPDDIDLYPDQPSETPTPDIKPPRPH